MSDTDRGPDGAAAAHVAGSALAAFGLTVNTLRFFQQKGILAQGDVEQIVGKTLGALERADIVSAPEVHAAREVLSAVAAQLGVRLSKPN